MCDGRPVNVAGPTTALSNGQRQELAVPARRRPDAADGRWWRDAVVYQVYVRSFADANGDGVGDLAGVLERLPYLRDLGVDALWFNPWYPSPMADMGYDVADYRAIDPAFHTNGDVIRLDGNLHETFLHVLAESATDRFQAIVEDALARVAADQKMPLREFLHRECRHPVADHQRNLSRRSGTDRPQEIERA